MTTHSGMAVLDFVRLGLDENDQPTMFSCDTIRQGLNTTAMTDDEGVSYLPFWLGGATHLRFYSRFSGDVPMDHWTSDPGRLARIHGGDAARESEMKNKEGLPWSSEWKNICLNGAPFFMIIVAKLQAGGTRTPFSRFAIVPDIDTLIKFCELIPPGGRYLTEHVFGAHRIMFDIERDVDQNLDSRSQVLHIDSWINTIRTTFIDLLCAFFTEIMETPISREDCRLTQANKSDKFSFHVVVATPDGVHFANRLDEWITIIRFMEFLEKAAIDDEDLRGWLFYREPHPRDGMLDRCVIDVSIFNRGKREMRFVGCGKCPSVPGTNVHWTKARVFQPMVEDEQYPFWHYIASANIGLYKRIVVTDAIKADVVKYIDAKRRADPARPYWFKNCRSLLGVITSDDKFDRSLVPSTIFHSLRPLAGAFSARDEVTRGLEWTETRDLRRATENMQEFERGLEHGDPRRARVRQFTDAVSRHVRDVAYIIHPLDHSGDLSAKYSFNHGWISVVDFSCDAKSADGGRQCIFGCTQGRHKVTFRGSIDFNILYFCYGCKKKKLLFKNPLGSGRLRPSGASATYPADFTAGIIDYALVPPSHPGDDPIHMRTLQLTPGKSTFVLKGNMGSGKTVATAKYLREVVAANPHATILAISFRRMLAIMFAQSFNLELYSSSQSKSLYNSTRLSIQLDSLLRLAVQNEEDGHEGDANWRSKGVFRGSFDVVVIDELESLLAHLSSSTLSKSVVLVWEILQTIVRQCRTLIVCDADISARGHEFIRIRSNEHGIVPNLVYHVNSYVAITTRFVDYASISSWMASMTADLHKGKNIFVFSNNKTRLNAIIQYVVETASHERDRRLDSSGVPQEHRELYFRVRKRRNLEALIRHMAEDERELTGTAADVTVLGEEEEPVATPAIVAAILVDAAENAIDHQDAFPPPRRRARAARTLPAPPVDPAAVAAAADEALFAALPVESMDRLLEVNCLSEIIDGIAIIDADISDSQKRYFANCNKSWNRYRVVAVTPTIGAGIDYTGNHFDVGYGFASSHSCSARSLNQMRGRVRAFNDKVVRIFFDEPLPKPAKRRRASVRSEHQASIDREDGDDEDGDDEDQQQQEGEEAAVVVPAAPLTLAETMDVLRANQREVLGAVMIVRSLGPDGGEEMHNQILVPKIPEPLLCIHAHNQLEINLSRHNFRNEFISISQQTVPDVIYEFDSAVSIRADVNLGKELLDAEERVKKHRTGLIANEVFLNADNYLACMRQERNPSTLLDGASAYGVLKNPCQPQFAMERAKFCSDFGFDGAHVDIAYLEHAIRIGAEEKKMNQIRNFCYVFLVHPLKVFDIQSDVNAPFSSIALEFVWIDAVSPAGAHRVVVNSRTAHELHPTYSVFRLWTRKLMYLAGYDLDEHEPHDGGEYFAGDLVPDLFTKFGHSTKCDTRVGSNQGWLNANHRVIKKFAELKENSPNTTPDSSRIWTTQKVNALFKEFCWVLFGIEHLKKAPKKKAAAAVAEDDYGRSDDDEAPAAPGGGGGNAAHREHAAAHGEDEVVEMMEAQHIIEVDDTPPIMRPSQSFTCSEHGRNCKLHKCTAESLNTTMELAWCYLNDGNMKTKDPLRDKAREEMNRLIKLQNYRPPLIFFRLRLDRDLHPYEEPSAQDSCDEADIADILSFSEVGRRKRKYTAAPTEDGVKKAEEHRRGVIASYTGVDPFTLSPQEYINLMLSPAYTQRAAMIRREFATNPSSRA